jgi:hypothetical protein
LHLGQSGGRKEIHYSVIFERRAQTKNNKVYKLKRKKMARKAKKGAGLPTVGDIVWASHPRLLWESKEPASVLRVGCRHEDDDEQEHADGILVKFQISNMRTVVPSASVQAFDESDANANGGGSGRGSKRRSTRAQVQQSFEATMAGKTKSNNSTNSIAQTATKKTKPARAMITPSPTVLNVSDSQDEEKPAAAQKKRGRSANARQGPRKKQVIAPSSASSSD